VTLRAHIGEALALLLLLTPAGARAWGDKGHAMTGRVAARKVPKEMPAFFRKAVVELGYLCPEPDRWRDGKREPALRGAVDRDHTVKLEELPDPLPPHRYDFFKAMIAKPRPGGGSYEYKDLGFAPYAIAEHSEMLTVNFMLWRNAGTKTSDERRIKRQIEQNIVHIAGLLSHFVTDTGMPLHTTIHGNGWRPDRAPNPKGFVGKNLHGRFESDFVEQSLEEKDFEPLVGPPRARGPWLEAAMEHIRASHQHVETTYALDLEHPFGDGGESPAHKRFTAERLAFSSEALRDFWYTAWARSADLAPAAAEAAAAKQAWREKVRAVAAKARAVSAAGGAAK
jgi:hypothetical protein